MNAPFSASGQSPHDDGSILNRWFSIGRVETMDTFLTTIVSDEDHWMYLASNGGLTAGRIAPDLALFPYHTQDKLIDLAHTTGPRTLLRLPDEEGGSTLWEPLQPHRRDRPREMRKKLDGTQVSFHETHEETGLAFSYTWGFSREYGFIRRCTLRNTGQQAQRMEIMDGLQNLMPSDVDPAIFNEFSILLDAYKRGECLPGSNLRLVYLNSIPTDRAEPLESLRCTTVWSIGLPSPTRLLTNRQLEFFLSGQALQSEPESRGQRICVLDAATLQLQPDEELTWYFVADVGVSTARAARLDAFLQKHSEAELIHRIEQSLEQTSANLVRKVAAADGLQLSQDTLRAGRHYSNALFNIMRGGIFPHGYLIPKEAFAAYLALANKEALACFNSMSADLPDWIQRKALMQAIKTARHPDLERLTSEYLPLAFSRRHGDPSRPWNTFAIRVRDEIGNPLLAYQGNWRDIFQNWEALAYAFPDYTDGMVARFLNASTADGYNPYRLTSEGFEWEVIEPDQPWSNIGYWGDHQLIYLLRLLEASLKTNPEKLVDALNKDGFSYARVPYRIRPFDEILANPRDSIQYDNQAEADIRQRIEKIGSDGKLLPSTDGSVLHVPMMEKLLIPLLAKLSNFVPGGGIWMNTQRPEWNDANNALAGYGLSVVTLAYCHRYVVFLAALLKRNQTPKAFSISKEIIALLADQATVFADSPTESPLQPEQLGVFVRRLGQPASIFRQKLYTDGLSGEKSLLPREEIATYLDNARKWIASSLLSSQRADGLYHSYNLLEIGPAGSLCVKPLYEMLEGQVAILSADLLDPCQSLDVLEALRSSNMYREDQGSYMLYPDRDPPRFLEKNRIPDIAVNDSRLLQALAEDPRQSIVETDADGHLCFNGKFHNMNDLLSAMGTLDESYAPLLEEEPDVLARVFEDIFKHHAFTGRSGTFFAYEGLGSIYWHMVSKLVLAIQELTLSIDPAQQPEVFTKLLDHYRDALKGLGLEKSPAEYGAFPTDAYSHTPKHAGAQQPGMTGQVKEDLLVRLGELGVKFADGCLEFDPLILNPTELLEVDSVFTYFDLEGIQHNIDLPAHSLAFTLCQVPIIYAKDGHQRLQVHLSNGRLSLHPGKRLPRELTLELFERTGQIDRIIVSIP